MSNSRPWDDDPDWASQQYLTGQVGSHRAVEEVVRLSPNLYKLRSEDGTEYEAFLTPVYILGEADYELLRATHPEVDLIILASTWNSCTMDVKERGLEDEVAIHSFRTLMQALHKDKDDFLAHGYQPTDRNGRRLTRWP